MHQDQKLTSYSITKHQYKKLKKNYNNKYDDLYLRILKIGRLFVKEGVSYRKLQTILELEGYDFSNDCIELAAKQWFLDSFHHYARDKPPANISELEGHLTCNFILKGEACLKLVEYESSKRNIWVAWLSFIIAFAALIYSVYHDQEQTRINRIENDNGEKIQNGPLSLPSGQFNLPHRDTIVNIHYHYYGDSSHNLLVDKTNR